MRNASLYSQRAATTAKYAPEAASAVLAEPRKRPKAKKASLQRQAPNASFLGQALATAEQRDASLLSAERLRDLDARNKNWLDTFGRRNEYHSNDTRHSQVFESLLQSTSSQAGVDDLKDLLRTARASQAEAIEQKKAKAHVALEDLNATLSREVTSAADKMGQQIHEIFAVEAAVNSYSTDTLARFHVTENETSYFAAIELDSPEAANILANRGQREGIQFRIRWPVGTPALHHQPLHFYLSAQQSAAGPMHEWIAEDSGGQPPRKQHLSSEAPAALARVQAPEMTPKRFLPEGNVLTCPGQLHPITDLDR
ncbi:hypothetical protein CYMTET_24825, partial [Cymbomonas tetramitiformis]